MNDFGSTSDEFKARWESALCDQTMIEGIPTREIARHVLDCKNCANIATTLGEKKDLAIYYQVKCALSQLQRGTGRPRSQ